MKRLPSIILHSSFFILHSSLLAAVPLRWTVETSRLQPAQFDAYRGEEIALAATLQSYGKPLAIPSDADVKLLWQTNGMGSAWWTTNAVLAASNVVSATFLPAYDPGAASVTGFIGVPGSNYRAAFVLRFRNSPGASPNTLALPVPTLDCAAVTFLNPESAPWSGGGGGGLTTNDVNAIIASSNLASVASVATLASDVSRLTSSKRDLTNNVCAADSFAYSEWSKENLPSGVTWDDQPFVAEDGLWTWHYTDGEWGGYSQGGMGENDNETFQTFGYGEGFTSTRTAIPVALSNDTFTTYGFVTNALAQSGGGVDTNAVREIAASASVTNLGAVAAATNAALKASASIFAPTSTAATVATVSSTVSQWENYWTGDKVRLSVTNYDGNTSGEMPRLRIEESQTNTQGVVTNWVTVWDEESRHTNYQAKVDAKVDGISNTVVTAAWKQTNLQLANKAPRAWQDVTSAGEAAPENTVWHTAPNTVFAGGTEYAHVAVGEGTICVLVDNGAPVYTEGEEGKFRFTDDSGQYYFGFDVRQAYTIGCRTDGISVDDSTHMVSLTYDLTSSTNPTILNCTNLLTGTWSEASVTWETDPPAGSKICYIDVGDSPQGFYKAQLSYAGGAKFVTNMQADFSDGIAASNQTLNVIQSVYPVITNNTVIWRVRQ